MENLEEILDKYNTKKNSKFNNYGKYYEKHLSLFRDKTINYLEIGSHRGESLYAMKEYFINANNIVGIDINPYSIIFENRLKNIFIEIGNQNNEIFLNKINKIYGSFDIIIDDGSHIMDDIITSFNILFPLLNNNGIYIIENSINIKDNFDFFNKLIEFKNKKNHNNIVDPEKIELITDNSIEYSLGEIIFTNASIIIYKEIKYNWIDINNI
jgi:hypothetical protein